MIPFNFFPEGTRFCVAGGYAACPGLAEDIDVWVLKVPTEDLVIRRAELMLHLAQQRYNITTEEDPQVPKEYEGTDDIHILKVGRVGDFQIMVTDAYTPVDLLQAFDVSTHAIAVDSNGVHKHPKWTPPHVPPVLLKNHSTSQARLEKIARRFGHLPAEESDIPF